MNAPAPIKKVVTTTVVITSEAQDGRELEMELPIPHEVDVAEPFILKAAIDTLRAQGGILVEGDEPEAVRFFPLMVLPKGINFKCRAVELATSMPSRSSLVQ